MTLKEAYFTNEHCVRSSWVALVLCSVIMLNGWIPFFVFANEIYDVILGDDPIVTPRIATYISGGA